MIVGMSRTRLSTTVDADLLESARKTSGMPDSALIDEALSVLARHRRAEADVSYSAYDEHPLTSQTNGEIWPPSVAPRQPDEPPCSRGDVVVRDARDGRRPVVVLSQDAVIPRHRQHHRALHDDHQGPCE